MAKNKMLRGVGGKTQRQRLRHINNYNNYNSYKSYNNYNNYNSYNYYNNYNSYNYYNNYKIKPNVTFGINIYVWFTEKALPLYRISLGYDFS